MKSSRRIARQCCHDVTHDPETALLYYQMPVYSASPPRLRWPFGFSCVRKEFMDVSVFCNKCNRTRTVSEGSAGMRFVCDCGGELNVPSLEQIRLQLGITAMHHSPEFEIPRRVGLGELPPSHCVLCRCFPEHTLKITAVCSEVFVKGRRAGVIGLLAGTISWCFAIVGFGFVGILASVFRSENDIPQYHGHDLVVALPLKLCGRCAEALPSSRQSSVLSMLTPTLLIGGVVSLFIDWRCALVTLTTCLGLSICQAIHHGKRQKERMTLVCLVPEYALLIQKYPDAVIV